MNYQIWFRRGIIGLGLAVMISWVGQVSQYVSTEFFGAGILTVNTFEKAFVPDFGAGETSLTTTIELRDHDGRSAFHPSLAGGGFSAQVGATDALFGGVSFPMASTAISTANGEVLRYVKSGANVIGTYYLGVTKTLAPETFTAFTPPGGDSVQNLTSDGNNVVYLLINTPAVTPRLEKYRVDFSTGLLVFDNVSTAVVGQNLNLFGRVLFHNGRLYYADSFDLYEVTESGGNFVFTDVGLPIDFGYSFLIGGLQGVTTTAAPRAGFDYFLIRGTLLSAEAFLVERTAGGVYSIVDLDPGAPLSFTPPASINFQDLSLTVETVGAGSGSNPLIVYVGSLSEVCARDAITLIDSCNDAVGVTWLDTGRNPGSVLFEAGGVVNITTRVAGPDYSDGPFPLFLADSFNDFERDFGTTFAPQPVWNQQALNTSGTLDISPAVFVGESFRDITIDGNLISENPVVLNIHWGQDGGGIPGAPDATVVSPGPFSLNLSGTHNDSRAGDLFRFDFPPGNEFLLSNVQITAHINTDSTFSFLGCYIQDGASNTLVSVNVLDAEGDLGTVTIDGNAAPCSGTVCTAAVPGIPVGSYVGTFTAVANDTRGNSSTGISAAGILIRAFGGSCGGSRFIFDDSPVIDPNAAPSTSSPREDHGSALREPQFLLSLQDVPSNDRYVGVFQPVMQVSLRDPVYQLVDFFDPSDLPLSLERCLVVRTASFVQELNCYTEEIRTLSDPLLISREMGLFQRQYYYPPDVRGASFEASIRLYSPSNPLSPVYESSALLPFQYFEPDFLVQKASGENIQEGRVYDGVGGISIISRYGQLSASLDGSQLRLTRLQTPSVGLQFNDDDSTLEQNSYVWRASVARGGLLCVQLYDRKRCFSFEDNSLLPPEAPAEITPVSDSPVESAPLVTPPVPPKPSQYQYPAFDLNVDDSAEELVSITVTTIPNSPSRFPILDPNILDIRLVVSSSKNVSQQVLRDGKGYPQLQATIPKGIPARLEFYALFPDESYLYFQDEIPATTPEKIVRGMTEVIPIIREVENVVQSVSLPQDDSGLLILSPQIQIRTPSSLYTQSDISIHGFSSAQFLKICLLDLSNGDIFEGNTISVSPQGDFRGEMAQQRLLPGQYASFPFADLDSPCTDLLQDWYQFGEKDPLPYVIEVSDAVFDVGVLEYQWMSSEKTVFEPDKFIAHDLTDIQDFLMIAEVNSPFDEPVQLYFEMVGRPDLVSEVVMPGKTSRVPLSFPGLSYGNHQLLVYGLLSGGEKTPDVVIPFQYVENGYQLLHGAAPDVDYLIWGFPLIVLFILLLLASFSSSEYSEYQSHSSNVSLPDDQRGLVGPDSDIQKERSTGTTDPTSSGQS